MDALSEALTFGLIFGFGKSGISGQYDLGGLFMIPWLVSALVMTSAAEAESVLELSYEPKFCVTTPCPQFRVLSVVKGEVPKSQAADLMNLDPAKSSMSAFRTVRVTGIVKEVDGVAQITVLEWEAVVKEILDKPVKTQERVR